MFNSSVALERTKTAAEWLVLGVLTKRTEARSRILGILTKATKASGRLLLLLAECRSCRLLSVLPEQATASSSGIRTKPSETGACSLRGLAKKACSRGFCCTERPKSTGLRLGGSLTEPSVGRTKTCRLLLLLLLLSVSRASRRGLAIRLIILQAELFEGVVLVGGHARDGLIVQSRVSGLWIAFGERLVWGIDGSLAGCS